jgi:amylosucrase
MSLEIDMAKNNQQEEAAAKAAAEEAAAKAAAEEAAAKAAAEEAAAKAAAEEAAAKAAAEEAAAKAAAEEAAKVETFVLRDCPFGEAGTVVRLDKSDAKNGEQHGMLDLNPAAIKAAKQK